jgi:hypothetical protein
MEDNGLLSNKIVPALKVHQWLKIWDKVIFNSQEHRKKPDPFFYLFSLPAAELKRLSNIPRRSVKEGLPRSEDLGIQRRLDEDRTEEIAEFIRFGYPWSSELGKSKRDSGEYDDLLKPGWLPTSIVVNILESKDIRSDNIIDEEDRVKIEDIDRNFARIHLPKKLKDHNWIPQIPPIEVIDGQHRLWAFENDDTGNEFELPIVAFKGLDISWQAYLFWTINIKPKRINASLAFDLYPLLRTENWLERVDKLTIYRETRAQELVEALWGNNCSPWYHRINMLGESGLSQKMVSQAAWIRSLIATYVRKSEGRGISIGGLFGSPVDDGSVLNWNRAEQAAFLIFWGQKLKNAVSQNNDFWATNLRDINIAIDSIPEIDPAFGGFYSLLNTDQGIRALLHITNDMTVINSKKLKLHKIFSNEFGSASDQVAVANAIKAFEGQEIGIFFSKLTGSLSKFDWRTSNAPGLSEQERLNKAVFRGSGGYKELRVQILKHLLENADSEISGSAKEVLITVGYFNEKS